MKYIWIFLVIILLSLGITQAQSIEIEQQKQTAYQLNTPFKAMYNHYHYLQPESSNPTLASYSLALVGNLTLEQRIERTKQLYQILKGNGLYFDEDKIPKEADYQDSVKKKYVYIPFDDYPTIFLERIYFRGQYIWVYSAETVANIPTLYSKTFPFFPAPFHEFLQKKYPEIALGLDYIRILSLLFLIIAPYIFFKLLNRLIAFFLRRIIGKLTEEEIKKGRIRRLARPISLYVTFLLIRKIIPVFLFPVLWSYYILFILNIFLPVFALLMVLGLIDLAFIYLSKNLNSEERGWYIQILPFLKTIFKIIAVAISLIVILENLDLNVTALLAGLSIGGLAFALAAQDTIKNLFGSVMIFIDQPFRVGDWVTAEGIDGEIEEIGVRSTRVRTFYNSVLHVPNGKLADMIVDNLGMRVYRRYRTTLAITYDTPPILIKAFLEGIREIIRNHPETRKDFFAVHFLDFQASSLGLLLNVFFVVPDFLDEWKSRESLNLDILELAETLGVRFAFSTQTLHIEQMPELKGLTPNYAHLSEEDLERKVKQFFEKRKESNEI
jgi:MscS family membrane protein